ncbi:YbeU/YbeR family protein [Salinicola endophyticus]|uniref:YbeU/YbeR family protein n=1 Tax=Salinicola endophyticus TaxID=1949083 RepID=A0AB74U2I4_9GAMM
MRELLVQWWAQQLTLCGWPEGADPRQALSPVQARERLQTLAIMDRDEFAWRLWESAVDGQQPPLSRLAALELLALGGAAGWLESERQAAWLAWLAAEIITAYPSLTRWRAALAPWSDPLLDAAGRALAKRERQGRGVDWQALGRQLEGVQGAPEPLWAESLWGARATFAPVLCWPFTPDPDERLGWQRLLREELDVSGRDALLAGLEWLARQGYRYGWDMDAARLGREGPEEAETWLASLGEQREYGQVLVAFLARAEPLEWAAWDWLRLIDQAYLGFGAGWLSAQEAETFAAHGLDLLQQRYADWPAMAHAYQRGRSLFEGRDLCADFEADWGRLLGTTGSPWQTPLAHSLDDGRRQQARRVVRERHASADAWVLALAAVREPDLATRQQLGEPLAPARREDAERYLNEVLTLRRDEPLAALARYWMPAQAHHLNQLAADARHPGAAGSGRVAGERRQALKACADHAATIFMAEKYAFYLLMAADSERYALAELQAQARSLAGVLGRFYATPQTLLAAWLTWETLLSPEEAPEETGLGDDIAWHLRDPGSRFHWLTPIFDSQWQEPGPRPSLEQFTAISLAGPLNEAAWQWPLPLAAEDRRALQEWLEHQYALQGAVGLTEFLDFLLEAGDRQEYQINYAPYTLNRRRLAEEIAILESGDCGEEERVHLLRLRHVRDNACGCNDEDMTAWDIAQLVDLSLAGRQLDWLDDATLTRYLEAAGRLAERHYSSWQAYAEGLYSGFGFFMDDTPERDDFLRRFREALDAWVGASPLLAGSWASLDFPGRPGRHSTPLHVDVLVGGPHRLH